MLALAFALVAQDATAPYLNPSLPVEQRSADLVSRLTLAEKVAQMQNEAPAVPRLGIPAYVWWSEALHGAVGNPVTVYPQAIGLASSFDTLLMANVASAISDEGRARYYDTLKRRGRTGMHQGLDFWAPNINIFRDPRWGRGQETYGEDPFLTKRMAIAFVSNFQGEQNGKFKAIATPKHFAVHSGPDRERHHFNAVVDPRDEWNTYLPAFRGAVTEAGAWSIMSAYSAVNGEPASASPTLLGKILRDTWGFQGYVVSDCGAIGDLLSGHKLASTEAEVSAKAVTAGCDLECGGTYHSLEEAVAKGIISVDKLDRSLVRLFEARIRLGMFDTAQTGPWKPIPMSVVDSPEHRALALKAARESVVLLKNDGILPLKGVRSLAVIGPNAADHDVPLGNYNGTPAHTTSVLEGIQQVAPRGTRVSYTKGSSRLAGDGGEPVPASVLPGGVSGEYFLNENLQGNPILRQKSDNIDNDWGSDGPGGGVPKDGFSARWTATLVPKVSGEYALGARADDGVRVWLDDKQIVNDWSVHPASSVVTTVPLVAGRSYRIRMEYYEHDGQASAKLVWMPPVRQNYAEAVNLAKQSDAVVMVLGISGQVENEENDRSNIDLPAPQQGLLNAVLATGKPVVVVLESGSCLTVSDSRIRGLVQAWYPGQSGGTAVAEVLFGKVNPAGRLPVTFYKSLAQVPPIANYKMDGRTYRYMKAKPLYPFGYGLSYTRFRYSDAHVERRSDNGGLFVTVSVRNIGNVEGDEVIQVYSSREGAAWPEPLRKLVAFHRAHILPGANVTVTIPVDPRGLAQADGNGILTILPGKYRIHIGGGQPGYDPATSGRGQDVTMRLDEKVIPTSKQRVLPAIIK
ncbi:glycoside hydrolase [Fimbriimonas ginsengisoli Gsoil 348]|uniref:Glycoside hydrolase n=2 Tax=Fimbriimonas ginsengisoli TaxID=1005039 RepID=A0A068NWL0_FIMGI|nr:glycoside hydrolase [Fimbriimonas ginsengisoli Gsoil 348]